MGEKIAEGYVELVVNDVQVKRGLDSIYSAFDPVIGKAKQLDSAVTSQSRNAVAGTNAHALALRSLNSGLSSVVTQLSVRLAPGTLGGLLGGIGGSAIGGATAGGFQGAGLAVGLAAIEHGPELAIAAYEKLTESINKAKQAAIDAGGKVQDAYAKLVRFQGDPDKDREAAARRNKGAPLSDSDETFFEQKAAAYAEIRDAYVKVGREVQAARFTRSGQAMEAVGFDFETPIKGMFGKANDAEMEIRNVQKVRDELRQLNRERAEVGGKERQGVFGATEDLNEQRAQEADAEAAMRRREEEERDRLATLRAMDMEDRVAAFQDRGGLAMAGLMQNQQDFQIQKIGGGQFGLEDFAKQLQGGLLDQAQQEVLRKMDEQKASLDKFEKAQDKTNQLLEAGQNANIA